MTSSIYYRHSGRFTIGGLASGLVVGILAGAALAFVYAYATVYIPVVGIFTFVLALGFGALVGIAAAKAMKQANVRSKLGGVVALVATLVAFWLSWVVWVYATFHRADVPVPLVALLTKPGLLWEAIRQINESGAWSLKGWTPTGTVLWVFWSAEAVLIVGAGWFCADTALADPFCESCQSWCQARAGVLHIAADVDLAELRQRVESKQFDWIEARGAVADDAVRWFRFDTHECPSCQTTNTVTVQQVQLTIEKGKTKSVENRVLHNLLLSSAEVEKIRAIASRLRR